MATIGVLGAGHIGRSFSLTAISHGHEVVIANARGPETIADLVAELGTSARAATAEEAAEAGDWALVAIPLPGVAQLPAEELAGKIVLTTCNYFRKRDGAFADIDAGRLTVPGYIQSRLSSSRVVRAFNHIDAAQIQKDGTPPGTPNRRALAYASDDEEAKALAAELYDEFGFDSIDAGGLDEAWRLDVDQPTFVVRMNADELRANLAKASRHLVAA
jgi:8-hydroxy-5-deazaflavin:NADPH oxidoreductase